MKTRCDNMAVAVAIRSGSCKKVHAMHLRRCLAFMEASSAFVLVSEHIKGEDNVVADALTTDRDYHLLIHIYSAKHSICLLEGFHGKLS